MITVIALTGGGIRGIATAGVLAALAEQRKLPTQPDIITGDSFGALIAALLSAGWHPKAIGELLINAPFKHLLTPWLPWGLRKPLLVARPVKLNKVAAFIDEHLKQPGEELVINAWDAEANEQLLYCWKKPEWAKLAQGLPIRWIEKAWEQEASIGTLITRSMALPGLVADYKRYMDGGLAEHPPLTFLPKSAQISLVDLGFAGLLREGSDTTPKTLLDRALYGYEVTASMRNRLVKAGFDNIKMYDPKIYDVDSMNLGLSQKERLQLYHRGYASV